MSGHYFFVHDNYDIIIDNNVARQVQSDILMGYDIAMGTYHDVTLHSNLTRNLIY